MHPSIIWRVLLSVQLNVLSLTQASWPSQMVPQTNVMLEMSRQSLHGRSAGVARGAGRAHFCSTVCVCAHGERNAQINVFFFLMRSRVCLYSMFSSVARPNHANLPHCLRWSRIKILFNEKYSNFPSNQMYTERHYARAPLASAQTSHLLRAQQDVIWEACLLFRWSGIAMFIIHIKMNADRKPCKTQRFESKMTRLKRSIWVYIHPHKCCHLCCLSRPLLRTVGVCGLCSTPSAFCWFALFRAGQLTPLPFV